MNDKEREIVTRKLKSSERALAEQRENLIRINRQLADGALLRTSIAAQVDDAKDLVAILRQYFGADRGE